MNFQKIMKLVNNNVILDLESADEHELRFNYKDGNDDTWMEVMPERYSSEEEVVAVINTEVERKKYGKIKTNLDDK